MRLLPDQQSEASQFSFLGYLKLQYAFFIGWHLFYTNCHLLLAIPRQFVQVLKRYEIGGAQ